MKKYILITLLVFSLLAVAQKPWTLQQCVETALANNRNVKQKALSRKSNEIAYQQAKMDLLPNLSASASQGWTFGRSQIDDGTYKNINSSNSTFSISSGITLFDGLRMKYYIDARMADLKGSEAELDKMKSDLVMSVSTAFLLVIQNKELLQISIEQLALTKSKIEQQKSLVIAGKIAEGELLEILAQESKEEMNRIKAEQTLKYSLLELAQILEVDDFENMDVIAPENLINSELYLLNPQTVYEGAIVHRPEIKSAEYKLKSSEKNVDIAKSNYYPSLTFGASVGSEYYNTISTPISTRLGFNLKVPIFNRFESRNQVKTAQLNVESNKLNVENSKKELFKTIQQAYQNALSAKARWDASIKSESASREAYRFVNQKYEAGRATVYEIYQAKSNLTQVLSEQTQAKYEYVFRIKIMEWLK